MEIIISDIEACHNKMISIRGKKHIYTEINIEIIDGGKVTLHQRHHLEELIKDFGEDFTTPVTTPT